MGAKKKAATVAAGKKGAGKKVKDRDKNEPVNEEDDDFIMVGDHDGLPWIAARGGLVAMAIYIAFNIRLYAIKEYGLVIHEFDPWFNYRGWLRVLYVCFF